MAVVWKDGKAYPVPTSPPSPSPPPSGGSGESEKVIVTPEVLRARTLYGPDPSREVIRGGYLVLKEIPTRVEQRNGQTWVIPGPQTGQKPFTINPYNLPAATAGGKPESIIFDPNLPESVRGKLRSSDVQAAIQYSKGASSRLAAARDSALKPSVAPPITPKIAEKPFLVLSKQPSQGPLMLPAQRSPQETIHRRREPVYSFLPVGRPGGISGGRIEPYAARPKYKPKGYETREEALLFEARRKEEGTATAALTGLAERIEKESKKISYGSPGLRRVAGTVALAASSAAVGVGAGAAGGALHPIRTAKDLGFQVAHPYKAMESLSTSLITRPAFTLGAMYGGGKIIGIATKAQPLRLRRVSFTSEIVGQPEKTVYLGLSAEKFGRAQPLIGLSTEAKLIVSTGTPKITYPRTIEYLPKTATDTSIFLKNVERTLPSSQKGLARLAVDLMRATKSTSSKYLAKEFIKETRSLSPKGVEMTITATRKAKGEIYGSFSQRQQLPDKLARTPGDIDIFLDSSGEFAEGFTSTHVKSLRKSGEKVRVSTKSPTLIESNVGGKWVHAVDIHASGVPEPYSPTIASDMAFGLRMKQKPITLEGTKITPLSEEGIRKGASIFALREGELTPEPHRIMVDIGDFFRIDQALIESKRFGKTSLLGKLEKAKSYYPKEVLEGGGNLGFRLGKAPSRGARYKTIPLYEELYEEISPAAPSSRRSLSSSFSVSPSPSPSPSRSRSPSVTSSISPSPSPSRSPSLISSISPSPSIPLGFKKWKGGKRSKMASSFGVRQPRAYRPTTYASLFGQRGKQPKGIKGMLTGLEARPIVTTGRQHRRIKSLRSMF